MSKAQVLVEQKSLRRIFWSKGRMQKRWKQAGLATDVPLEHIRLYKIAVFHLQVISFVRLPPKDTEELYRNSEKALGNKLQGELDLTASWQNDGLLRLTAKLAIHAIYALGFEMGEVIVALGGDGRRKIMDAAAQYSDPELLSQCRENFVQEETERIKAYPGFAEQIRLGADPEFVLVSQKGKLVPASRFFGEGRGGEVGADSVRLGNRLIYPYVEIRPEPADTPQQLLQHIQHLLAFCQSKIKHVDVRWAAGAMPLKGTALGGHIHMSGVPLTIRLLRLLDRLLALPFAAIEDSGGRGRRPRYGMLGDYRMQSHGGFEYRTLPSWLISPVAAKAAFAISFLCVRNVYTAPDMTIISTDDDKLIDAYYAGDKHVLQTAAADAFRILKQMDGSDSLMHWLSPFFAAAERGESWNEAIDFREKWNLL